MLGESDSSLYEVLLAHRLKLGIGAIFVLMLFFGGLVAGYLDGRLNTTEMGVIISAVGALGTLVLATITVVSVLETRVQTRERLKEQDKHIEERILIEINELLETVEENERKLGDPEFDWETAVDTDGEVGAVFVDIEPLEIDHPTVNKYFASKYSEAQEALNQYNNNLIATDGEAAEIFYEGEEYLQRFLGAPPVRDSNGEVVDTGDAISLVLSQQRGKIREVGDDDPAWWEWEDEIRIQLETAVEHRLERFFDRKTSLEVSATTVENRLNDVRNQILEEYPIRPQS